MELKKNFTELVEIMKNQVLTLITLLMIVIVPSITIAQIPNNIPKEGLVGWYPFNGNANDESGNENHGIVNGATLSTDRYGNENHAYLFSNSYIQIPSNDVFNSNNLSVSLWVSSSNLKKQVALVRLNYSNASNEHFGIAFNDLNKYGVEIAAKYNNPNCIAGEGWQRNEMIQNIMDSTFHHVVGTISGNIMKLYIDGILVKTINPPYSQTSNCWNGDIQIGRNWASFADYFQGKIDDIGIWNRALTEQEINGLFEGNDIIPLCSLSGSLKDSLVAYYPFCGNANDESGNGLDGTVNGAELTFDRFGNSNSAYSFTTNQDITVPNTEDLNLLPMTISLWYNIDTLYTGDDGNIFSKYTSAGWNGYIIHVQDFLNERRLAPWYIRDQSNRVLGLYGEPPFHQADFENNTWYNFVFTIDENGGKIYVNGELYASDSWTGVAGPSNNSHLWKIGGLYDEWFHGQIDDIGIWNRVLTEQEIKGLFEGNDIIPLCSLNGSLTDSLVAYYPFCGNANDESGNGLDGIVNGAELTTDRYGNESSAYEFNGINSHIVVNDTSLLDLTNNFSISSWFEADSIYDVPGTVKMILSKHRNGTETDGYVYGIWNDSLSNATRGIVNFSATPYYNTKTYPSEKGVVHINSWYHFVTTYSKSTNTLKYYVDGFLIDSLSLAFNVGINEHDLLIGAEYLLAGNGIKNFFNGKIDDIGIWNKVLTEQEIKGLFEGNDIIPLCSLNGSLTDSLVAYYPFCGNANDESGNGLNGTVNGAGLAFDRYGNPNSAYSFTTNQYITIPNTEDKNLLPLTISLWYNADTVTAGNIFSKYSPGGWNGYQILASDNRIVDNGDTILNNGFGIPPWYIRNRDNKVLGYYTEPPFLQHDISFDTWYHYVFVVDKTGGKIYVNGKLIATDIWTGEAGTCNNNILWEIGGLYDDWYYGKIDDIGIWNRTLTEQEILNLYNGTQETTLEINCPESITVSCSEDVPLPDTSLIRVIGNCKNITIEFISDISDNMSCPETITRTYRATDDCGNIVTCSQLIIVNDLEPPVISCPPNMTFTCNSLIPSAAITIPEFIGEGGYISDNCGELELFVTENVPEFGNILGTFIRTYETVDNCGNVAKCSQVIVITDVIPPTFTTPPNITISKDKNCNYYAGTEITGDVTDESDECSGNIQANFNDELEVEENGDETITRTWTLTDDYGNFTTGVQTIYIEDVTPPYIFCPSDVSVKNKSEIPEPISSFDEFINDNGEISDNCEIITSSFELFYEFLDTLVVPNELKRTYIISDKAGNESVCLHKIAIENATSLNEINSTNEFQFKIYPNPAKEYVTFDIQNIEILTGYSLKITNILGQEIFQTEINQPIFRLDTRNWAGKGLYFVNIINSYGVTIDTKKIVLQ